MDIGYGLFADWLKIDDIAGLIVLTLFKSSNDIGTKTFYKCDSETKTLVVFT